jgi:hypothetical protein
MKNFNQVPPSLDPETEAVPQRYVVPRSAVNEEVWRDVIGIYFKNAYDGKYEPTDDDFLMMPVEDVWAGRGYRIGSIYSHNSKLEIVPGSDRSAEEPMVGFDFYANESLSAKDAAEAAGTQAAFRAEVDEYLQTTGKAVPEF